MRHHSLLRAALSLTSAFFFFACGGTEVDAPSVDQTEEVGQVEQHVEASCGPGRYPFFNCAGDYGYVFGCKEGATGNVFWSKHVYCGGQAQGCIDMGHWGFCIMPTQ